MRLSSIEVLISLSPRLVQRHAGCHSLTLLGVIRSARNFCKPEPPLHFNTKLRLQSMRIFKRPCWVPFPGIRPLLSMSFRDSSLKDVLVVGTRIMQAGMEGCKIVAAHGEPALAKSASLTFQVSIFLRMKMV